jgi:hypothetical protein
MYTMTVPSIKGVESRGELAREPSSRRGNGRVRRGNGRVRRGNGQVRTENYCYLHTGELCHILL